jgi:hypothetical protein
MDARCKARRRAGRVLAMMATGAKGSKVHIAVDTLGHLLALKATPANEQERTQVNDLMAQAQEVTGGQVKAAFVDQGYTGQHGVELIVVKLAEAKRGFVLLPRHWS